MDNIRLLTATADDEARTVLAGIVAENEERKRLTIALTTELLSRVDSDPQTRSRSSLVFAGSGWHQGVVGIVASRLVDAYGKPAAVIAIDAEGQGKGSLRSVPRVHLGEALDACRAHLHKGGGHAMAAGITLSAAQVPDFSAAFERHVSAVAGGSHLGPSIDYDGTASIQDIDDDFIAYLPLLAPFGIGNPEPLVLLQNTAFVTRPQLFGKESSHVRGALTNGSGGLKEMVAWRAKDYYASFSAAGSRFDFLVRPQVNRWRGQTQFKLIYVDGKLL